jgi:hypothetical protein
MCGLPSAILGDLGSRSPEVFNLYVAAWLAGTQTANGRQAAMCGQTVAFALAVERDFAEQDRALAALLVGEVFTSGRLLPLDPEDVKTCVTLVGSDSNVAFLITTGRRGDEAEDSAKSVEGPGGSRSPLPSAPSKKFRSGE